MVNSQLNGEMVSSSSSPNGTSVLAVEVANVKQSSSISDINNCVGDSEIREENDSSISACEGQSTDSQNGINAEADPPSPVCSDSWRCDGSPSALLKVEALLSQGVPLSSVLQTLCPSLKPPPDGWNDATIMSILSEILDQPPRRQKLPQYNTFEDAIDLFRSSKRILILTGAGVSVSCGIPDFRSKDGIYARLHEDFPDLPDPTAMFDIRYFQQNPVPFYDFATEIFPGQFEPSISHKFIYELEKNNKLLRNYTQNIDTLENQTGIQRVVECHGSFSKATCQQCHAKFDGNIIKEDVMSKRVPRCPHCGVGVIKPDIVFFGEDLGEEFHRQMALDKDSVDLLVVIGSSLKVRPVSLIPFSVSPDVPQILINREPLSSYTADIELLGNCDDIIRDICLALGGSFQSMLSSHAARLRTRTVSAGDASGSNSVSIETETEVVNPARRTKIDHEAFMKLMESVDQPAGSCSSNGDDGEGGPSMKRPRLEEELYSRRYVAVESQLPPQSYFQLNPNRAVFPGAELFYDLEAKVITRPTMNYRCEGGGGYSSDEDDDSLSEYNPFNGNGRGGSEPPDLFRSLSGAPSRCASCEPVVDSGICLTSVEYRQKLEENENEEESFGMDGDAM